MRVDINSNVQNYNPEIITNNLSHYNRINHYRRGNTHHHVKVRGASPSHLNHAANYRTRIITSTSTQLYSKNNNKDDKKINDNDIDQNDSFAENLTTSIIPYKIIEDIYSFLSMKLTILNNPISLIYPIILLLSYVLISWKMAFIFSISFSFFWYFGRQVVEQGDESYDLVDFMALSFSFLSSYFLFIDNEEENKFTIAFSTLLLISSVGVMFVEFNNLFSEDKEEQDLEFWDNEMEKYMNDFDVKNDDVDK